MWPPSRVRQDPIVWMMSGLRFGACGEATASASRMLNARRPALEPSQPPLMSGPRTCMRPAFGGMRMSRRARMMVPSLRWRPRSGLRRPSKHGTRTRTTSRSWRTSWRPSGPSTRMLAVPSTRAAREEASTRQRAGASPVVVAARKEKGEIPDLHLLSKASVCDVVNMATKPNTVLKAAGARRLGRELGLGLCSRT